jgi:hypothetical protein
MTPDQLETVCAMLADGVGRNAACLASGVAMADFAEAIATTPVLRSRVAMIEAACRDNARHTLYAAALEGKVAAAKAYLDSVHSSRMGRLDYAIRLREVRAKEAEVQHTISTSSSQNFSCLSTPEFRRYRDLYCALKVRDHTPAEAVEFSSFTRRMSQPAEPTAPKLAVTPYRPANGHANGHNGNGHANGNGHQP